MLANCFYNWIGLKGCSNTTPLSGTYINSLYDITLPRLNAIANNEQASFAVLWDNIQQNAWFRLLAAFRASFKGRYNIKTFTQICKLPNNLDFANIVSAAPLYRGFVISLEQANGNVISNFTTIKVSNVQLYSSTAVSVPTEIAVFDVASGVKLYNFNVNTLVAGWNTLSINQTFVSNKLFIAFDASNVNSHGLPIAPLNNAFYDCMCQVCSNNCEAAITGAEATINNPLSTINALNDSAGLTGTFYIACDFSSLLCSLKDTFTNAWLYALAIEVCEATEKSDQWNRYTTVDFDRNQEAKLDYTKKLNDELNALASGIELNTNDCCILCDNPIAEVWTML